jgi:hypothetical protein
LFRTARAAASFSSSASASPRRSAQPVGDATGAVATTDAGPRS